MGNFDLITLEALKSGQLKNLQRIKIAEGLQEFPREIFDHADSLEILDLSDNLISELPSDFGKLHRLRIVFFYNNRFTRVPEQLADCPNLEMMGFKSNQIQEFSENSLPPKTRWLILTDNQLSQLPSSIGNYPRLEKLMLAGNRLTQLPSSLQQCHNLALLRISANQLHALPDWIGNLPKLAWLAFSGNPFCPTCQDEDTVISDHVSLDEIELDALLGQGASGMIYLAHWRNPERQTRDAQPFAVKIFKGHVTSDGYPKDELAHSLQISEHPNLVQMLAKVSSDTQHGLAMKLIPSDFFNLGLPPSLETCSRDTFADDMILSANHAVKIARGVASAVIHLHQHQITHGDLYAHNILINEDAEVLFGDFGGASTFKALPSHQIQAIKKFELRAYAHLLDDLIQLINPNPSDIESIELLENLRQQCWETSAALTFEEIVEKLSVPTLL